MRISARTASEDETERIARAVGEHAPAGTVVALVGPLGAGKTCFVRGLARGLGADEREVASPTFLYLVEYGGGRLSLHHADLYRLSDLTPETAAEAFASIGLYDAMAAGGVTAVEWWDRYVGPPPQTLLVVEFAVESVDRRALTFTFSGDALAAVAHAIGA